MTLTGLAPLNPPSIRESLIGKSPEDAFWICVETFLEAGSQPIFEDEQIADLQRAGLYAALQMEPEAVRAACAILRLADGSYITRQSTRLTVWASAFTSLPLTEMAKHIAEGAEQHLETKT